MNEKRRNVFKGVLSHLPHCFAGCYVVVFIIQVAKVMSSGKSLQQFGPLDVHLCQEAAGA